MPLVVPVPVDAVRFWLRVTDVALDDVTAWNGWMVVDVIPDPDRLGVRLVEVADPNAPAAASGLLCEPTFQRHYDGTNDVVTITDYGIPASA